MLSKAKAVTRALALVTVTGALAFSAMTPAAHAATSPSINIINYGSITVVSDPGSQSTHLILAGNTIASSQPITFTNEACTYYGLTPYGYLATCPQPATAWEFLMNGGTDTVQTSSAIEVVVEGTSGVKNFTSSITAASSIVWQYGGSANDNLTVNDPTGVVPTSRQHV
jgi:hypothetical protein